MRIFLSVEHPAWAHQFRPLIEKLQDAGSEVQIAAIDKDGACELLNKFGLPYILTARTTGKNAAEKAWLLFALTIKYFLIALRFKPDLLIGRATPMMAVTAFLLRKKHVIFEDTEHSHISLFFCRLFSTVILTPKSFRADLGPKQIREPLYKESFYLHPEVFSPDLDVITKMGLKEDEPYVLLRFVSWQADHDLGQSGFSTANRLLAVQELSRYAKVFISSELPLEPSLAQYQISIEREKIHSFVYYASLVFGESSTMASEAAMLGTHSIFCDFEGRGYTDEQETVYELVYNFRLDNESQLEAINKGVQLLKDPDLKRKGKKKGANLAARTLNGTEYMYHLVRKWSNC